MDVSKQEKVVVGPGDALIVTDVQNDFLPGGSLAVPGGDQVIPPLNHYIEAFRSKGLPIYATRDWHPPGHSSFKDQGGPWPPHCVIDSKGAEFARDLRLPPSAVIVSKGSEIDRDAYSGFQGTDLDDRLRSAGSERLLIGGLTTDYCILHTVRDALARGYRVLVLEDAVRAVNVHPGDGSKAIEEMRSLGAIPIRKEMTA